MEGLVIEGVVIPGRQIGHTIGFPTANVALEPGVCERGVYRSRVQVEGIDTLFDAMSNVGCNPSVGGSELRLESHLFGFEGNLYGRRIRVFLLEKIREEICFGSVEELQAQIAKDKEIILNR